MLHTKHVMLIINSFSEIPLFHILNARITFGNIFGLDQEVPHVGHLQETNRVTCLVDDICFETPSGYAKLGKTFILYICSTINIYNLLIHIG